MEVVVPPDDDIDGNAFNDSSTPTSSNSPSSATASASYDIDEIAPSESFGIANGFHHDEDDDDGDYDCFHQDYANKKFDYAINGKFDYAKYAAINGHVKNYSSYLLRHQEEIFSSPAFQSSVAAACNKRNTESAKRREMLRKKEEEEEEERKKGREVSQLISLSLSCVPEGQSISIGLDCSHSRNLETE